MGVGYYWVGETKIQQHGNRIALPKPVAESGVATSVNPLFWAYSAQEEAVVISRSHDMLNEDARFDYLSNSKVNERWETDIPEAVTDLIPGIAKSAKLHFVMSNELKADNICMVLPDKETRA